MKTGLNEKQLETVRSVFVRELPQADIFIFGSRATGKFKPFSDLDIAVDMKGQKIPIDLLTRIENSFEESDLPFKIDIVDLEQISPEFKKAIEDQKLLFRKGVHFS